MPEFTNPPNFQLIDFMRRVQCVTAVRGAEPTDPQSGGNIRRHIMKCAFTPYVHGEASFREVERFLGESHRHYEHPRNWQIDRWNFTFTVSRIMHGESIENWERRIGLWRDNDGRIVAMAHEEEQRGDVFLEFESPDVETGELIDAMLDFAERACALPRNGGTGFGLRVAREDELLASLVARRGYSKADWSEQSSVRPIDFTRVGNAREGNAREGNTRDANTRRVSRPDAQTESLSLISGAAIDPAMKALAHARAFGYANSNPERLPSSVAAFTELPRASSYRSELDLAWQDAAGDIVSFVGLWFDPVSRLAILEPVGTIPAYRRMRLAERLIDEGARRVAALGATALYVGSDQEFYKAIGFEVVTRQDVWEFRM